MSKPIVIAGPCAAESQGMLMDVGSHLKGLATELDFDFVFKASFDKANRTSIDSPRGAGLEQTLQWFANVKDKLSVPVLTDVHETSQVQPTSEVCEVLQIPAFLCRQTDLVVATAKSSTTINIKKGQFLAPSAMASLVSKAREANPKTNIWVTERGTSFGYGDLVVDMRSFKTLKQLDAKIIFDITHSTQAPPSTSDRTTSGADRSVAPLLARAATATGYIDGFFLEVHPEPSKAVSDRAGQLNLDQASNLLRQIIPLWKHSQNFTDIDSSFIRT